MKTDDIEAFVAVLRSGSLNAAALSLGLTQPAITRRLQSLEQDLRVELLDRHTKPLKPTRLGQEVYGHCRAILREMDALRERVAGGGSPVRTPRPRLAPTPERDTLLGSVLCIA